MQEGRTKISGREAVGSSLRGNISHPMHPTLDQLQGFLRGDIAAVESLAIVRHLMTGCPECVAVTRQSWLSAERFC
jgi:hypothetical protein